MRIGRPAGVVARVERHTGFAQAIARRAREDERLELLSDAQLSVVCFRYVPPDGVDADAYTERILERLRRETPTVPSSTRVGGSLAIRPCFIKPPHDHARGRRARRRRAALG